MRDILSSRLIFVLGITFLVVLGFIFASQFFLPVIERKVSKEEPEAAQLSTKSEKEGATTRTAEERTQHKKTSRRHKARRHKTPRKRTADSRESEVVTPSEEESIPKNLSSLSGKVLDVWTGRGIPNAKVAMSPYNVSDLYNDLRKNEWKERDEKSELAAKTRSSKAGAFSLSNIPAGDYRLKTVADGYGEDVRLIWVPPAETIRVPKIYLEPSYNISGRLTNERYQPIPKATVGIINGKRKTRTQEDGSYTLEVPGGGNYHLLFEAKGYGFARLYDIPAGSSDVNVTLYPGASISGKVVDAQTHVPVAKARVYAVVQDQESRRGIDTFAIARTDVKGNYAIRDIGAAHYMLWAKHRNMASPVKLVGVRQSEAKSHIDLELLPSASISGRITDKESGNPVGNMRIVATSPRGVPYTKAVSRHDGSYQLTSLGPGEYRVRPYTSLYIIADESPAKGDYSVFVSAGSNMTGFDFILSDLAGSGAGLEEPARVSGKVVDESGHGIARVRVLLGLSRSTLSDEQGDFFFDKINSAQIMLLAKHPEHGEGWAWLELKSGEEKRDVEITLKGRTQGVSGRVTDAKGHPLANAHVRVQTDGGGAQRGGTADIEGRYRVFGEIPEGRCDVQVEKEGYEGGSVHDLLLRSDELTSGINFQLNPLGQHHIIGKVVDGQQVPISGTRVTVTGPGEARKTRTDFSGTFKVVGLRDGLYRVCVNDWSVTRQTVNVDGVEVDTTDLKIVLKRSTGSISGRVIKTGGRPVRRFALQYFNQTVEPPTEGIKCLFSERGEFLIGGLEAGEYKLVAISEEGLSKVVEGIVVEEGQLTSCVVMQIPNGGSVSGIVLNTLGAPIEGAFLSANGMQGVMEIAVAKERGGKLPRYNRFVITGPDGIFRIDNVRLPGTSIGVWHPDYAPREVYVEVTNGETTPGVRIVLTEGGSVLGTVRDEFGVLLSGVDIYTDPAAKHVKTDGNGSFRIERLNPMTYGLGAWIRGVRRASGKAEIKEGQEASVELVIGE